MILLVFLGITSNRTLSFQLQLPFRKIFIRSSVVLNDVSFIDAGMEKLAAVNAELLAKREGAEMIGVKTGGVKPVIRCPLKLLNEKPAVLGKLLEREGCIGVPNVLSSETVDELLAYVNNENEQAKQAVLDNKIPFNDRFGGVNCRGLNGPFGQRQDMYLPMSSPIVRKALSEVINNLLPLLQETVTINGMFHEISSLVSDPGAPRQCIHADTIVLPCPQYPSVSMEPLYTFFIALQDVEDNMGHTVFLPRTHTPAAHLLWNTNQKQKEQFISNNVAVQSQLKKGDVAIFDSRILHCGRSNSSSKRRALFYFTLSKQQNWPLPNGLHGSNSVRKEDLFKWQIKDVL
eukprot:gene10739-22436_t